jgi:DNA primase
MSRKINYVKGQDSIFERLNQSFTNGTFRGICSEAKKWLNEKQLTAQKVGAGYNSNQFHIRNKDLIPELIEIGFLTKFGRSRYDTPGYTSFGARQIMFPLRNEKNAVVNFCSVDMKTGKQTFLNQEGFYPEYPKENTKRLFIVVSVMDAATIIESGVLKETDSVMAMLNKELTETQREAIKSLKHLKAFFYLMSIKSLYEK